MARTKRWTLWGLGAIALVYFGLRFENEVGKVCPVCASELTWRQRGLALSETNKLWTWSVTEETEESAVSKEYLGSGHQHSWQTWSNLYIALNGRSGGHPWVRWNPAAKAWRYNDGFPAAVRAFVAANPGNMAVVRRMFLLPDLSQGEIPAGSDIPSTIEKCRGLFEKCGEAVPAGWQRAVPK